jgi:hypothetical protein
MYGRSHPSSSAAHQADVFLSKQRAHLDALKNMHAMNKNFGKQLSPNGEIAVALAGSGMSEDDLNKFLTESKDRARAIAQKHVQSECIVNALGDAILLVKNEFLNRNDDRSTEKKAEDEVEDAPMDLEKEIMEQFDVQMQKPKHQPKANHKFIKDMTETLGDEKDDEDDDLIVTSTTDNFKCPITATVFVMPMRNIVCGHTYSKAGIEHVLRTGHECPVAGCTNKRLHRSQLEKDIEMEIEVKKYLRKQERLKNMRLSQSHNIDDDDDDAEIGGMASSNVTTFIE